MADSAIRTPDPEDRCNLRSDGEPGIDGYLGEFRKGPAVFVVYEIPPDRSRYPNGPTAYLVDCYDPAGPSEVCRLTGDTADTPAWRGSWRGDAWCPFILKQARALIDASGTA